MIRLLSALFTFLLLSFMSVPGPASAQQELDCLTCHAKYKQKKVIHAAVEMGCPTCHTGINTKLMPHKKNYKIPKGLSAAQPDLCYGCHDKAPSSKKVVHGAVAGGCTSCHDPHSSDFPKLLSADIPAMCYNCHDSKIFTQKTVHAALGMGCKTCHDVHSADNPKLLTTAQPDLCHTCHDKASFTRKNVHAAVGMGCGGCHNPHSTANEKLLIAAFPDVCTTCHDKTEFEKKTMHAALGMGCPTCHAPHSSDEIALLKKKPLDVCLECHPDVPKNPHAIAGFGAKTHPVGIPKIIKKKKKKDQDPSKPVEKAEPEIQYMKDPTRPDRVFYCGSCHGPHSTDGPKLLRFNAQSSMSLCVNCHKK